MRSGESPFKFADKPLFSRDNCFKTTKIRVRASLTSRKGCDKVSHTKGNGTVISV